MKRLKILRQIIVRTHVDKLLVGYIVFICAVSGILAVIEPEIDSFFDALWYSYACVTTVGFGDVLVKTAIGRWLSVLLSIYSVLIIAIVTGVVVNFYTQMIQLQQEETLTAFMDKLERLPEMSKDELEALSERVRAFQLHRKSGKLRV